MAAEECLVGAAPDYKGRIGSINSTLFTYDYIGSRVLQRSHYVSGDDIDVDYAYDNLGRVTDIASSDGTIDFDYTYAAGENNIADIAFNHRTSTPSNDFVYDNLDRLASVEYLDVDTDTEAFTMDLLGNRTNVNLRDGSNESYLVDGKTNRYTAIEGPLAQWKLDETTGGTAYDSVGSNDGTLTGFPASPWTTGKIGNALDFDGIDDCVNLGKPSDLNFTGKPSFTISAWINPDEVYNFDTIISNSQGGGATAVRFNFDICGNRLRAVWGNGTTSISCYSAANTFTTDAIGSWHHVAVLADGSDIKIYIDGQQSGSSTPVSIDLATSTADWFIGRGFNNAGYSFNGKIDEVMVVGDALTDAQVYALYKSGSGDMIDYDDAGNLVSDKDGYLYTYDYENRLVEIARGDGDDTPTTIVTYTYDALGRRIKMVDHIAADYANDRLYYFSDNWQVLEEYSVAAVPARTAYYVWGNYIDELLFIWNGGSSLAAHALQDHLFSTVALINVTDGTVLERYEYNAYGKATVYTNMNDWQTGTPPTTQNYSEYGNPYLFTGRRLDTLDSGSFTTYYYRNRYYDADTGRFLQKDPLDYVDGMNLYEYVRSNPCIGLDPQGTDFIAVASRNVAFSGRGHYSCQLWKCCKKFTPLNYTEGFSESEIKKKCGGKGKDSAKKIDYFELKVLKGYNVWGHWGGHTYVTKAHGWHIKHDPWMSEIRYKGREDKDDKEAGTDIMPVMNGSPVVMKIMFEYTKMKAGTFPWAEQYNASDTGIKNWPKSMYKVWQTNSNTFIRWVMGPGMTEMTVREHPGDYTPRQNTDEWGNSGKLWQFYPAHQPWKNSDPAPPRPSH